MEVINFVEYLCSDINIYLQRDINIYLPTHVNIYREINSSLYIDKNIYAHICLYFLARCVFQSLSNFKELCDTIWVQILSWLSIDPFSDMCFGNSFFQSVVPHLVFWIRCFMSWMQSPSTVLLEPKKIISATVSISSLCICHKMIGPDTMILVFWMLSFIPVFSFSSFTFIKRLFSSASLSAIRVVSSAYLTLLTFFLATSFLACDSSSPAFNMMYSA